MTEPDPTQVVTGATPAFEGVVDLERVGRTECLDLLALGRVGRVGLVVDGHIEILPVNYALDGDAVLFRTAQGSALNRASMCDVAFEVDHFDESTHTGWSVLVHGHADDIGDAIDATSERLRRLVLVTWAPGTRQHWFVIRPTHMSGRRLRMWPAEL